MKGILKVAAVTVIGSFLAACGSHDKDKFIGHWHGEKKSIWASGETEAMDYNITDNGDNLKISVSKDGSNMATAYASIKDDNTLSINDGRDLLQYDNDTKTLRDMGQELTLKKVGADK